MVQFAVSQNLCVVLHDALGSRWDQGGDAQRLGIARHRIATIKIRACIATFIPSRSTPAFVLRILPVIDICASIYSRAQEPVISVDHDPPPHFSKSPRALSTFATTCVRQPRSSKSHTRHAPRLARNRH